VRAVDELNNPMANTPFRFVQTATRTAAVYFTDAEGHARIGGHLRPGHYALAPLSGYEGDTTSVELKPDTPSIEATLRFQGTASLDVQVSNRTARPSTLFESVSRQKTRPFRDALQPKAAGSTTSMP
jgi:hypothetical protein